MIFCNDIVFSVVDKRFIWRQDNIIPDNTKVWGEWIWEGRIDIIRAKVDRLLQTNIPHIFVMINEANHPELPDFVSEYQSQPRLKFFGDFLPTTESLTNHRPSISWFVEPTNYYSKKSNGWQENSHQWAVDLRQRLVDYSPKRPKLFDALLGMEKRNRNFLYDAIINDAKLKDQTFLSYYRDKDREVENGAWNALNIPGFHAWPDGDTGNFFILRSPDKAPKRGKNRAVSRYSVVPWDIYNQSYYSVVAETSDHNIYTQFTEKTAKPIIGRRLFVAFCGYRFLYNLRRLGFKTFDGIIDESYDQIEVTEERWAAALNTLKSLSLCDPKEIYHKTEKIRIHNYKHFLNTNWHQYVSEELDNILG